MGAPAECSEDGRNPMQPAPEQRARGTASTSGEASGSQWTAGVLCILLVAIIWTFATVLKQIIFHDLDYNEPLILTYVCNSCYMVHLPAYALGRCGGCIISTPFWRRSVVSCEDGASWGSSRQAPAQGAVTGAAGRRAPALVDSMLLGLAISPLWFLAQWTYSVGVGATSVTSSTVISTTSVVWTLLGSVLFLGEKLTTLKVIGILACMLGDVVNIWGNDGGSSGNGSQIRGDLLCLLSAMIYATYTTVLKKYSHLDTSVMMLFGTLGASCFVAAAPLVLAVELDGLKRMSLMIFGLLVFNGIFDNVLSQFAWAKAVQWTSPTMASVGLTLTIPLGVVSDLLRGVTLTNWSYLAGVLVIGGFLAVSLASRPEEPPKPSSLDASPRTPLSSSEFNQRAAA